MLEILRAAATATLMSASTVRYWASGTGSIDGSVVLMRIVPRERGRIDWAHASRTVELGVKNSSKKGSIEVYCGVFLRRIERVRTVNCICISYDSGLGS